MKTLNSLKESLIRMSFECNELSREQQKLVTGGGPGDWYPTLAECAEDCTGGIVNPPDGSGGWNEKFKCVRSGNGYECDHYS